MTYHFCTISTSSHLYKVYALHESIMSIHKNSVLHVLVVDSFNIELSKSNSFLKFYELSYLSSEIAKKIINKYSLNKDKLRWSLKSVYLSQLLSDSVSKSLVYVDNDIAFFNDFLFLFDLLDKYNILLSPHYYPINPNENQNWLEANFKVGLYNAGFFACNINALEALNWWSNCCLYRCERNSIRGLWDDQKYLDVMPIHFEKVKVLHHKGCNLADWNEGVLLRKEKDGEVFIADKWKPIFIHFTGTTIHNFLQGNDIILKKYFDEYVQMLKKYKNQLQISKESYSLNPIEKFKLAVWRFINKFNKM